MAPLIINDGTRESFAKISQSFHKFFEVFVCSETRLDLIGPSGMPSGTFGCAQKRSKAFGRFLIFLKALTILAMFQIVRKSNRRSYAIINGIFGLAGMLLLFLVLAEWWTAVLEKVSTMG